MVTRKGNPALRIGFLAFSLLFAGACLIDDKDAELKKLSAQELYQKGEAVLEVSNKPQDAVRYFQEIERRFPYSVWARRALIMTAYGQHRAKRYEEARVAAERFLAVYPSDDDAPYAAYLVALSYYDQIDDVGRDQRATIEALKALRRVIEEYPDSDYGRSASLKFDLAFDHLAGKEVEVGRYYLKKRNYAAAINRFRLVVEDFQTTSYTPEALYRLVEAYLGLGLVAEAQTAAAILGYNYQSSPFYQDGYNLLSEQRLIPKASAGGWLGEIYRQMVLGEWL